MQSFRLAACLAVLAIAGKAPAGFITIFNTGVDGSGTPLAGGALDPHYSFIQNPAFGSSNAFVGTVIPGSWLANSGTSKWIGPGPGDDLALAYTGGTYIYRTIFDLTGLNPLTAILNGLIATDNNSEIFLNGVSTGITTGLEDFGAFKSFTINSGFTSGINTLDFRVFNQNSTPTGLRVEWVEATVAAADPVPLPATAVPMGIGALGLAMAGWFRRRAFIAA